MRILITNDDGIEAEGIKTLARVFAAQHDVTVVSPNIERSGASHSLTFNAPIQYQDADFLEGIPAYKVFGTPGDCVKFALAYLMKEKPDLVLSGINRGANLGTDIMYSGTVAAAFEGAYMGVKSIAVSLNCKYHRKGFIENIEYYENSAAFVLENLDKFIKLDLPHFTVLNINVPFIPKSEIKGHVFTPMGIQEYDDVYMMDETDNGHFWLRGKPVSHGRNQPDCDVEWIKKGYVTITPVSIDMTDYGTLKKLKL